MRLLASEFLRFRSRRIVRWLMLVAVLGIGAVAMIAGANSHKPTDAQIADALRRRDDAVASCVTSEGSGAEIPAGMPIEEFCQSEYREADFVAQDGLKLDDLDEFAMAGALVVLLIGLVIGASMVGASWQTGTITTILTWEPRRIRWFLARLVATAVGAALVAAALLAIFCLALAAATALRGSTTTSTPWLADAALAGLRIALVTGGLAVIGASVAMIGRHTAAALGAVFVYLAVLESVVRGLRPAMGRFLLGDNVGAVVTAMETELSSGGAVFRLTPQRGAVVLGIYVVGLALVAAAFLRSRDVT
jgi:ABC-2 type transport system permease protein